LRRRVVINLFIGNRKYPVLKIKERIATTSHDGKTKRQ
jgi:hypothetical protein